MNALNQVKRKHHSHCHTSREECGEKEAEADSSDRVEEEEHKNK